MRRKVLPDCSLMLGMAVRVGLVLMLIFFRPLHSPDLLADSVVLAFETWPREELLSRFCGLYLRTRAGLGRGPGTQHL